MKEFVTAVEEVLTQDEDEAKIAALVESGKTREEAQAEVEGYIPFELAHMEPERDANGEIVRDEDGKIVAKKVVDRVLHAYQPTEGQLIFMLASLGRGQSQDQRFASIINIMLASLRDEDAEYLEGRLLTRDRKNRLPSQKIEEIFEYLVERWFGGKVTVPQSDSAKSQPTDGPN